MDTIAILNLVSSNPLILAMFAALVLSGGFGWMRSRLKRVDERAQELEERNDERALKLEQEYVTLLATLTGVQLELALVQRDLKATQDQLTATTDQLAACDRECGLLRTQNDLLRTVVAKREKQVRELGGEISEG